MTLLRWYQFKQLIEHASGISMDALHILIGFILFMLAARLFGRPLKSFLPWTALLVLELANEVYDFHVERWPSLASQVGESVKDVGLTMALPTLILLTARWRPGWLIGGGNPH